MKEIWRDQSNRAVRPWPAWAGELHLVQAVQDENEGLRPQLLEGAVLLREPERAAHVVDEGVGGEGVDNAGRPVPADGGGGRWLTAEGVGWSTQPAVNVCMQEGELGDSQLPNSFFRWTISCRQCLRRRELNIHVAANHVRYKTTADRDRDHTNFEV